MYMSLKISAYMPWSVAKDKQHNTSSSTALSIYMHHLILANVGVAYGQPITGGGRCNNLKNGKEASEDTEEISAGCAGEGKHVKKGKEASEDTEESPAGCAGEEISRN